DRSQPQVTGPRPGLDPPPCPLRWPAVTDTTALTTGAWAVGLATLAADGRVLDTWYPAPALAGPDDLDRASVAVGAPGGGTTRLDPGAAGELLGIDVTRACRPDDRRGVERV